jgi:hypothetical protein
MASYISISFKLRSKYISPDLLYPFFQSTFYNPISLGAVQIIKEGYACFVAGYALEDFLSRVNAWGIRQDLLIQYASSQDPEEIAYLTSIAEMISKTKKFEQELSPIEDKLPILGITSVDNHKLNVSLLKELEGWLNNFDQATIDLYGSLNIPNIVNVDRSPFRILLLMVNHIGLYFVYKFINSLVHIQVSILRF